MKRVELLAFDADDSYALPGETSQRVGFQFHHYAIPVRKSLQLKTFSSRRFVCGGTPETVITTVNTRNFRLKVICCVTSGPNLGNNETYSANAEQNAR